MALSLFLKMIHELFCVLSNMYVEVLILSVIKFEDDTFCGTFGH